MSTNQQSDDDTQPSSPKHARVLFGPEARAGLLEGMQIAAEAVGCTLGPRGKTVLISRNGNAAFATKDGVTVSKSIRLRNPIHRMGADLIKESASRTNDVAGDGTTTSTVLTYAMAAECAKLTTAGLSSVGLKQGIEDATSAIVANVRKLARPISTREEITNVGTISANGDKHIGEIISAAMERVGRDGIITVEDAKGMSTTLDVVEGMQFPRGYLSPYFVTNNDRMHASHTDGLVLLADKKLSDVKELVPILEQVLRERKPLLVIAEDVEGPALQALIVNKLQDVGLKVVAIKTPGYGSSRAEFLKDIAVLTGATIASSTTGTSVEKLELADLGRCKKFVVDAKSTTIVGTGSEKAALELQKHTGELRQQMLDPSLTAMELGRLRERVARLASGVAIIRVGGATELEMIERKHRIEDALNATRAAVEEGIVPGGGTTLVIAARKALSEHTRGEQSHDAGFRLVVDACQAPLRKIVSNAGGSPDVVVNGVLERSHSNTNQGWNAALGDYCDLIDAGIIDPAKVTRVALEHASSVAVTFATLDAVVADDEA